MHPALRDFADELHAVLVRIAAYASGIILLALIVVDLMARASPVEPAAAPVRPAPDQWTASSRPHPAFAVPLTELDVFSSNYEIFRHTEGGRRDVMSWAGPGDAPLAQIEIYRPGGEIEAFTPAVTEMTAKLAGIGGNVQAAGVISSKFGPIPLVSFQRPENGRSLQCLGFAATFDRPRMQLAGWSCPSRADGQVGRTQIVCAIDRLTLLSAGGDQRLAELFARAELKRGACDSSGNLLARAQDDWLTSLQEPRLRGRLARD